MRKLLLACFLLAGFDGFSQVATFESQTLIKADTFYVNYSNPFNDAGFDDQNLHFPYVWDTSYGGTWSTGFAFSNMRDSVTSGWGNQFAAKALTGFNNSDKYAVYWSGYNAPLCVRYNGKQEFKPVGVYVTNSTYTYNSLRDGDFVGKKFGGVTGHDSDWYSVTVHGYRNGKLLADSQTFFLADFRNPDDSKDYIVRDWTYWNLNAMPAVDSIFFTISSSDVGAFGINTPTYFCIDNLQVGVTTSAATTQQQVAKIYPNPATDRLFVELNDFSIRTARILDVAGKVMLQQENTGNRLQFELNNLIPGVYFLKLEGPAGEAVQRIIKH